ncbi:DUF7521 family protein [Halobellus sp. EA9]|uniref:DUF7521 family protein n=1 Tax=Halobellus sp. EA9 TaxID=3421647 RepID=UPI003EBBD2E6
MSGVPGVRVAAEAAILSCGLVLASLAYRAYRNTESAALGLVTVGFCLVSLGAVAGVALPFVAPVEIALGLTVQNVLTAVGLAVLVYSLRVSKTGIDTGSGPV